MMEQSRLGRSLDEVPYAIRRSRRPARGSSSTSTDQELKRDTAVDRFQGSAHGVRRRDAPGAEPAADPRRHAPEGRARARGGRRGVRLSERPQGRPRGARAPRRAGRDHPADLRAIAEGAGFCRSRRRSTPRASPRPRAAGWGVGRRARDRAARALPRPDGLRKNALGGPRRHQGQGARAAERVDLCRGPGAADRGGAAVAGGPGPARPHPRSLRSTDRWSADRPPRGERGSALPPERHSDLRPLRTFGDRLDAADEQVRPAPDLSVLRVRRPSRARAHRLRRPAPGSARGPRTGDPCGDRGQGAPPGDPRSRRGAGARLPGRARRSAS